MAKFRTALALGLAGGLALLSQMAGAEGLTRSALPKARPAIAQTSASTAPDDLVIATVSTANAIAPLKRPQARPADLASRYAAVVAGVNALPPSQVTEVITARPKPRPRNLDTSSPAPQEVVRVAQVRTLPGKQAVLSKKGSVCGDPSIRGERLAPITSRVRGCGIAEPVRVTSIAGVKFSTAATIDCDTAVAAKHWIERGIQPAFNEQVIGLHIAGSYVCRPRNNKSGAKVSEHGRGRALDVMGFVLADGRKLNVLRDYRKSAAIKSAHRSACGPFGTTLGPGSDGYHEDHIHVDTVSYRNGNYCR